MILDLNAWDEASSGSPEDVQGRFPQGDAVRVDGVKEKLEHLWPLVIPVIICTGQRRTSTHYFTHP